MEITPLYRTLNNFLREEGISEKIREINEINQLLKKMHGLLFEVVEGLHKSVQKINETHN